MEIDKRKLKDAFITAMESFVDELESTDCSDEGAVCDEGAGGGDDGGGGDDDGGDDGDRLSRRRRVRLFVLAFDSDRSFTSGD